jgi:hypothetical protein
VSLVQPGRVRWNAGDRTFRPIRGMSMPPVVAALPADNRSVFLTAPLDAPTSWTGQRCWDDDGRRWRGVVALSGVAGARHVLGVGVRASARPGLGWCGRAALRVPRRGGGHREGAWWCSGGSDAGRERAGWLAHPGRGVGRAVGLTSQSDICDGVNPRAAHARHGGPTEGTRVEAHVAPGLLTPGWYARSWPHPCQARWSEPTNRFPGWIPTPSTGVPGTATTGRYRHDRPSPNRCAGRSEVSNLGRSYGVTTNQKAGTDLEQVRLVYTLTLAPR